MTPNRASSRRKAMVSASVSRPRRSPMNSVLRTSNHHRLGAFASSVWTRSKARAAVGWSSSSNAHEEATEASRTKGMSGFVTFIAKRQKLLDGDLTGAAAQRPNVGDRLIDLGLTAASLGN